jgi:hypothetical protein
MRPTRSLPLPLLLLVAACGRDAARPASAAATHAVRRPPVTPDTAVFVQQAGAPTPISAVMQMRIAARDAQITLENAAGQQASGGAPGADAVQQIPGSRSSSVADVGSGDRPAAAWHAAVSAPVLVGEHYLVELFPSSPREDSASIELSADDRHLATTRIAIDATSGAPALFEIVVGSGAVEISPQIEPVEIVPTCGTAHLVRTGGRADLYARFEVIETGERGDVHLPPRDADAKYRAVGFKTLTKGGVRILYLGRELARAELPEACPVP